MGRESRGQRMANGPGFMERSIAKRISASTSSIGPGPILKQCEMFLRKLIEFVLDFEPSTKKAASPS